MALDVNLSQVYSLRAPVGGLNLRDGLANMPELDCYLLDNLLPNQTTLKLRNGWQDYATSMGTGIVQSIIVYSNGSTNKMLGCANNQIYDATALGAASSIASGFGNNYWSYTNFRGVAVMVNGIDTPRQYNGTTISTISYTGSGLSSNLFVHVNSYRNRLYFVEDGSLSYWYAGVDSISGTVHKIDLSGIFRKGGQLLWTATWTRDSGAGADDLWVAATNKGELVVYEGANPADASWNLIGRFVIPELIGRRSYVEFGGDVVLITSNGAFPLSKILQFGNIVQSTSDISDLVNPAFKSLAQLYSTVSGWEAVIYPRGYYMLVNVPYSGTQAVQYVCNLQTGRWCRFTNQNAYCWAIFNNNIYFGGLNGKIYRADTGTLDGSNGISFQANQAFNLYGLKENKLFSMARPMITLQGSLQFNLTIAPDFSQFNLNNLVLSSPTVASPWNTSPWNSSPWTSNQTIQNWYDVGTYGRYGSLLLRGTASNTTIEWHNTDLLIEPSLGIV